MAISNFIPAVWSEQMLKSIDRKYVGVANCNRDFEGDILEKGNVVKICGLNPVTVSTYTKDSNLTAPQTLSDTLLELKIDQAKYFNFQIDDIDRTQASPKLMDYAVKSAASALADAADRYVFSVAAEASTQISMGAPDVSTIIDKMIEARTKLIRRGCVDAEDIVIEVSPDIAEYLFKAKMTSIGDNTELFENGCIGKILGCKVFVSNNIAIQQIDDEVCQHKCIMRTKRALSFAEQLSEVDAYRPELRFADAVKGLHLYGAKIVYQDEILAMCFNMPMIYE